NALAPGLTRDASSEKSEWLAKRGRTHMPNTPNSPQFPRRLPTWIALALPATAACLPLLAAEQPAELRTAAAVRFLSVEQARQNLPVRLRGVVTFFDAALYSRFIQDETAGIYLF